MVEKRKV